MYFVVWGTDKKGMLATRERVREAHRARLHEPGEHRIKVVSGGPTLDQTSDKMNGSLLVIEADTIDAVRSFVEGDPYVTEGVFASYEIRPWKWTLGAP